MNLPRRRFLHLTAGAVALSAASQIARAQAYPSRPVRVIVPFPPGGATDIFARLAAQKLTERFGKQFYIENIAGATGNVGTAQAARAAPDGHTLLIAFSSYVVNPTLFAKLPFDPDKDLAPVTLAVVSTNVITVHPLLPARNLEELVALIKSNPGKYSFASGGVGTQPHLLGDCVCRLRSTSCMSPSTARARRLPRRWPATPRSPGVHWRRPHSRSKPGSCAR
jgi:tripartite-type tricarboxylate transporter receptor subunit TctC